MFHDIIEKAWDFSFHIYIRPFCVVCHTKLHLSVHVCVNFKIFVFGKLQTCNVLTQSTTNNIILVVYFDIKCCDNSTTRIFMPLYSKAEC